MSVLLLNDMVGYGNVALSAMLPVLNKMGLETCSAPTALISNPLCYGDCQITDTTEYLEKTFIVWEKLGFTFESIITGFLADEKQAQLIRIFCENQKKKGAKIFCDPIMGDEGHLYNGIGMDKVQAMRGLLPCADYIIPNYTEACFLAGELQGLVQGQGRESGLAQGQAQNRVPVSFHEKISDEKTIDVQSLASRLTTLGPKTAIITSVERDGQYSVCGYDSERDYYFEVPYEMLSGRFFGTGDIFSALFSGFITRGVETEEAVRRSVANVADMIRRTLALGQDTKYLVPENIL